MIQSIINSYPLFLPRFYVFLRFKILPIAKLETYLPKTGRILDIGCGYGLTTIYFAKKSPARQVEGIELNAHRITVAKIASQKIVNMHFCVDNLANHQQGQYDCLVAIDLLHHLNPDQKNQLLSKCYDLLKPHGTLIIKDINTRPLLKYLWNYLHDYLVTIGSNLAYLDSSKMINLVQKHRFKITQALPLTGYFYPHYLYVFKKI